LSLSSLHDRRTLSSPHRGCKRNIADSAKITADLRIWRFLRIPICDC
jgi:hypothetical protein